ncbi:CBS domain-containing protein [Archaeoglobus neptunius]|uniref:CBS domain-containing protein n=1 Tax=Archaeoglobus neptunius TaxID=2798580 RepID=UPI001925B198|nr:CBS domain-containing protein [Archaeoglobus neptunius]
MFPEIEELRRKRKKLGVSQKKLAELVGVSQPLIARIESGNFDPKLSLVKKIHRVLEEIEGGRVEARVVMNSPVIYVSPSDSLKRVAELMTRKEISQLPVIERGRVVGSITETDIVRAVIEKGSQAENIRVGEVMGEPFPTIDPDESVSVVSKLLMEYPAVLVVQGEEIVGIVTKQDVMKTVTRD